jgi:hypothetical protein
MICWRTDVGWQAFHQRHMRRQIVNGPGVAEIPMHRFVCVTMTSLIFQVANESIEVPADVPLRRGVASAIARLNAPCMSAPRCKRRPARRGSENIAKTLGDGSSS